MNMFDEARALQGTIQMCGITQEEIAKKLNVSQSYVANKIRLLQLGADLERAILSAGLSERHARAVLKLDKKEDRLYAIEKIAEKNMTVTEAEAMCDLIRDKAAPRRINMPTKVSSIASFKDTLRRSVETLRSLGVDISRSDSSYGNKTYITLCIEE